MRKVLSLLGALLAMAWICSYPMSAAQAQIKFEDCLNNLDDDGDGKIDCDDHADCHDEKACNANVVDACNGPNVQVNLNTNDCSQAAFACCREPHVMCEPHGGVCQEVCRGQTELFTACDNLGWCCPVKVDVVP
jgi:hypothetical protein